MLNQANRIQENQVILTKHFGMYTERMKNPLPLGEFIGIIKVHKLPGHPPVAFLYVSHSIDDYTRYDLPEFCQQFNGKKVVILGRPYEKIVGERTYNKMIVIRIKKLKNDKQ